MNVCTASHALSSHGSLSAKNSTTLAAGSSLMMPSSMNDSVRTMSVHFYLLAREGKPLRVALYSA